MTGDVYSCLFLIVSEDDSVKSMIFVFHVAFDGGLDDGH